MFGTRLWAYAPVSDHVDLSHLDKSRTFVLPGHGECMNVTASTWDSLIVIATCGSAERTVRRVSYLLEVWGRRIPGLLCVLSSFALPSPRLTE